MVELKTSAPGNEVDETVANHDQSAEGLLAEARRAQREWSSVPVQQRLRRIRKLRDLLARDAKELTQCFSSELQRTAADSVTAEILPLAEAARFLERNASNLLRPRWLSSRDRPLWLPKVQIQLRREPVGAVLIIGPSNYPLFLPGVQALQALVAGNAVLLKPGRGGRTVALALRRIVAEAGVPASLFTVLDESVASARAVLSAGVDKVVMTGSATSGIAVLRDAAEQITPAIVELSGCDSVFIRRDADVPKTVRAVVFGMTLNGGATCIAPRRIFVNRAVAERFERAITNALQTLAPVRVSQAAASLAEDVIREAVMSGAKLSRDRAGFFVEAFEPLAVLDARPEMEIMRSDLFAPVVSVMRVDSDEEAVEAAGLCPYSLGATIFGEEGGARKLAERVPAGVVVVNDMIVPTADPRLPFGGSRRSGFGKTRGAEGLLEMTNLKAVVVQRAKRLRHLETLHPRAEELFLAFLSARHRRNWADRIKAWRTVGRIVTRKNS